MEDQSEVHKVAITNSSQLATTSFSNLIPATPECSWKTKTEFGRVIIPGYVYPWTPRPESVWKNDILSEPNDRVWSLHLSRVFGSLGKDRRVKIGGEKKKSTEGGKKPRKVEFPRFLIE
ncbi:hypothetical protein RUM43_008918 [Polyplax serrata]|uniref:Uncharacterized protein n=1 Tax=Polyplax serrata TaxID=468196 RepID=A0AAN8NPB0_POLSC